VSIFRDDVTINERTLMPPLLRFSLKKFDKRFAAIAFLLFSLMVLPPQPAIAQDVLTALAGRWCTKDAYGSSVATIAGNQIHERLSLFQQNTGTLAASIGTEFAIAWENGYRDKYRMQGPDRALWVERDGRAAPQQNIVMYRCDVDGKAISTAKPSPAPAPIAKPADAQEKRDLPAAAPKQAAKAAGGPQFSCLVPVTSGVSNPPEVPRYKRTGVHQVTFWLKLADDNYYTSSGEAYCTGLDGETIGPRGVQEGNLNSYNVHAATGDYGFASLGYANFSGSLPGEETYCQAEFKLCFRDTDNCNYGSLPKTRVVLQDGLGNPPFNCPPH
jgi:hypothetical protein